MFPKNHGEPWYEEDDKRLECMFIREGCDIDTMAEHFGRTKGSITSRLRHMGYGEELDMVLFSGKGLTRYIVLGYRDGKVSKLASCRGRTPDDAIEQALKMEEHWQRAGRGYDSLVLITIGDASGEKGTPMNVQTETITANPTPRYNLTPLYLQTRPKTQVSPQRSRC